MFAFDRSARAVLVPLALLLAVVIWSKVNHPPAAHQARLEGEQPVQLDRDQTVAANLPSR